MPGDEAAARKKTREALNCNVCPGTSEKFEGLTCRVNGPGACAGTTASACDASSEHTNSALMMAKES